MVHDRCRPPYSASPALLGCGSNRGSVPSSRSRSRSGMTRMGEPVEPAVAGSSSDVSKCILAPVGGESSLPQGFSRGRPVLLSAQGWRINESLEGSTETGNQSRALESREEREGGVVMRIYRPPPDRSGPEWPWRALARWAPASRSASACFCSSGRPTRLRGKRLLISAARAEAV